VSDSALSWLYGKEIRISIPYLLSAVIDSIVGNGRKNLNFLTL
jgi:hypothetical protein